MAATLKPFGVHGLTYRLAALLNSGEYMVIALGSADAQDFSDALDVFEGAISLYFNLEDGFALEVTAIPLKSLTGEKIVNALRECNRSVEDFFDLYRPDKVLCMHDEDDGTAEIVRTASAYGVLAGLLYALPDDERETATIDPSWFE